jgi:hypothetical protein
MISIIAGVSKNSTNKKIMMLAKKTVIEK